jgi:D-xylonolactonase
MGFTPDGRVMYYTDSNKREIYLFDCDRDSGAITNQRLFVRTPEGEGVSDGLTVDAEGFVWSARWGDGCVVRYTLDAKEERRLRFPCAKVSSLTFGGENYADIFVTTAGGDNKAQEGPAAGALFAADHGIRGVPEFLSRVCL